MNIIKISEKRHTCKAYDETKKIPKELINQIKILLRNAPSSVNSQPWHYIIIETDAGKERILPAISDFNHPRITKASHVILFCAKNTIDDNHINNILLAEEHAGRFPKEQNKIENDNGRRYFVDLNTKTPEDTRLWTECQIYISLGMLLLGVATLGLDATPIEGFNREKLDETLNLSEKGLHSVVIASLGYHHPTEDFNARFKKGRLPMEELFTTL